MGVVPMGVRCMPLGSAAGGAGGDTSATTAAGAIGGADGSCTGGAAWAPPTEPAAAPGMETAMPGAASLGRESAIFIDLTNKPQIDQQELTDNSGNKLRLTPPRELQSNSDSRKGSASVLSAFPNTKIYTANDEMPTHAHTQYVMRSPRFDHRFALSDFN